MTSVLTPEFKQTTEINFAAVLGPYFAKNYPSDKDKLDAVAQSVVGARKLCMDLKPTGRHLEYLNNYLRILEEMRSYFPFDNKTIQISFTWYNSWNDPSQKGRKPLVLPAIELEIMAILFNTAVIHAKLGAAEILCKGDYVKACNFFGTASGIFHHILVTYPNVNVGEESDLSGPALRFLEKLMLAYSQDCYVLRAEANIGKKFTANLVASLCTGSAELYNEANDLISLKSPTRRVFPQELFTIVTMSMNYYHAKGLYFMGMSHIETKYAISFAYLAEAEKYLMTAKSLNPSSASPPLYILELIQSLLVLTIKNKNQANSANNQIQCEPIPQNLPKIRPSCMSQPISFPPVLGTQMFSSIANPVHRTTALKLYQTTRDGILAEIKNIYNELLRKMLDSLSDLGLPASFEADEKPNEIPPIFLERSKVIIEAGGLEGFNGYFELIMDMRRQIFQLLDYISDTLKSEEADDRNIRNLQGGKNVQRPQSSTLTSTFQADHKLISNRLDNSASVDSNLRNRLKSVEATISSFERGPEGLASVIPKVGLDHHDILLNSPQFGALKNDLKNTNAMIDTVKSLNDGLKAKADAYAIEFADSLVQQPATMDVSKFVDLHISKFNELRDSAISCTDSVKDCVNRLNASFITYNEYRNNLFPKENDTRDNALYGMNSLSSEAINILENLRAAIKFYTELLELAKRLNENVLSFAAARNIEASEISARISGRPLPQNVPQQTQQSGQGGIQGLFSKMGFGAPAQPQPQPTPQPQPQPQQYVPPGDASGYFRSGPSANVPQQQQYMQAQPPSYQTTQQFPVPPQWQQGPPMMQQPQYGMPPPFGPSQMPIQQQTGQQGFQQQIPQVIGPNSSAPMPPTGYNPQFMQQPNLYGQPPQQQQFPQQQQQIPMNPYGQQQPMPGYMPQYMHPNA